MSDNLVNPHDAFFKQYLSQPAVATDFLRQHLPAAVTAQLDLDQLRLEKDSLFWFTTAKNAGRFPCVSPAA